MDDSICITLLASSYSKQLEWFEELSRIVQKTLSQLVLSRGDIAPVMASVLRKQEIIDLIMKEREKIKESADFYRCHKARMKSSVRAYDLDRLLAKLESAIQEFLEGENQLKRYLEHLIPQSNSVSG